MAGKAKLISQRANEAVIIPSELPEIKPKKNKATEPLMPNSAMDIVGIIAKTKNTANTIIKPSKTGIFTSKIRSSK